MGGHGRQCPLRHLLRAAHRRQCHQTRQSRKTVPRHWRRCLRGRTLLPRGLLHAADRRRRLLPRLRRERRMETPARSISLLARKHRIRPHLRSCNGPDIRLLRGCRHLFVRIEDLLLRHAQSAHRREHTHRLTARRTHLHRRQPRRRNLRHRRTRRLVQSGQDERRRDEDWRKQPSDKICPKCYLRLHQRTDALGHDAALHRRVARDLRNESPDGTGHHAHHHSRALRAYGHLHAQSVHKGRCTLSSRQL